MDLHALPTLTHHLKQAFSTPLDGAQRLFHGRGKCYTGLEQITVDHFSGHLLIALFKEPGEEFLNALEQTVAQWQAQAIWADQPIKAILLQHRARDKSPTQCLWGQADTQCVATEQGLMFQLDLLKNQNCGLFLDMRNGRQWLREHSQGKRVLNLFSYTCGFSVAAMAGGADSVINFDMAKSALSRGRENHRLNGHSLAGVKFFAHDILKSWGKIRKFGPYDIIVIDPPSFQKGSFAATSDYQKILRRLPELLAEKGLVLACVNDPNLNSSFLIEGMKEAAPQLSFVERLANPEVFKDIDSESGLKALVFKN